MNALEKARARLKELTGELETLLAKASLTKDELESITTKTAEVEAKQAEIETLQKAEAARASASKPANSATQPEITGERDHSGRSVPAVPERKMTPDQKISLVAASSFKAKHARMPALKVLEDNGYFSFAKELELEMRRKAVDTTVADVLIPDPLSSEIIELLRPETTFFQGNPKRVEFTHGKFVAPRGATGATASYVGEAQKKPVTEPSFDAIQMQAKKLAGTVLITMEAKNWSLPNIEAYIRDDLRAAMAQATDLHAYFGTGAGQSPTGILNVAGVPDFDAQNYFADPLNPTITEIDAWASDMILSLTLANIGASQSWKWLMNYRTIEYLKNLRVGDTTGVYAYPELRMERPMWKGFGVMVTNQVPINLGVGGDESVVALMDFRHILYGEEAGITVKTSDQASIDVNGTVVHLWQQNMEAILTETQHDFGLRHVRAVAKTHAVRWGATAEAGSP